jgi:hypothetical protein
MRRAAAVIGSAMLVAAGVGCAATVPPATTSAPESSTAADGASLEVENNGTLDVRVFILLANSPMRLGTVAGMSTARFELRRHLLDREVRLYATPIGGSTRARTDVILIRSGQLVMWALDNKLRSFRLSIY